MKSIKPDVKNWLDTGCGTGYLVGKVHPLFKKTTFILSDPSIEMMEQAKRRLNKISNVQFLSPTTTQNIEVEQKIDVITAIQAHLYCNIQEREKATEKCYELLEKDGVYITFENIAPISEESIKIGLKRWQNFQLSQGRKTEVVEEHTSRYNVKYFPITIQNHINLLKKTGFKTYDVFWYSYMQAGFYGVK